LYVFPLFSHLNTQHTGFTEYVLFKDWIPRTALQYWATILALVALGVLYEFLIAYHTVMESSKYGLSVGAATFPFLIQGYDDKSGAYRIAAFRFILKFVTSTLGYALMLVTV
jgi:hypothetical protein